MRGNIKSIPTGLGTSQHDDQQNALANAVAAAVSANSSAYPWLHNEFPSPGSSNASLHNSYSQPASVGSLAMDLFSNEGQSGMPVMHQKVRLRFFLVVNFLWFPDSSSNIEQKGCSTFRRRILPLPTV
jgi:hypothetical protein